MSLQQPTGERIFRGIPVSDGVCRGRVLVLGQQTQAITRLEISEKDIPIQVQRFEQALIQSRQQLLELHRKVSQEMGTKDAAIFDAHTLILEDPMLVDEVIKRIEEHQFNAEYALQIVLDKYLAALSAIQDELLRERAADLRDVGSRVLNNLLGRLDETHLQHLESPCVIISHDLTPSTTALLNKEMVLGFGIDIGSRTSHTAILARALRIPAVVGLKHVSADLATGQYVLLDGFNGLVIIDPTDQTLFEYGQIVRRQFTFQENLRELKDKPAISLDGHRVILAANIEQTEDAGDVVASGAEGVGLFRTEFLYLNRTQTPTEDEQYEAYRRVADAVKPHSVIIRTLDIGGDKFMAQPNMTPEVNSFYGWRAIRFCLQEKELFRAQLRAILRASATGNIKMMYPMISCLTEVQEANDLMAQCKRELTSEGKLFDSAMDIGVMIEIPSAVMIANELAKHVKFFSIGTNDLIQYSMAVDRMNEKVAHLYQPTHPAILRLIKMTVQAAHNNGIWVGVCGEMAGDPTLAALLLGLGIDELSAAPSVVPQIKFLIRQIKMEEARELAEFALKCDSAEEIAEHARALTRKVAPSVFVADQKAV